MSDDRIYVRFKGKTLGPLADQKVRDLVRRGQITRMHELSSDGLTWTRAEEFGDFFAAPASRATVSPNAAMATQDKSATNGAASVPIPGQAADDSVQWYANIGGENQGPVTTRTIVQWIQSGEVTRQTLVWRAGFDDWRSAESCLSEHFASPSPSGSFAVSASASQAGAGFPSKGDGIEGLIAGRAWTFAISMLVFVWSGLGVIYFVTTMIVGSEAKWVPFGGSRAVIYGLTGLVMCGIVITGAVLLLNYSTALKRLAKYRDAASLSLVSNRLNTFWRFVAITVIVFSVIIIGGAVLLLVMSAAAVGAAS